MRRSGKGVLCVWRTDDRPLHGEELDVERGRLCVDRYSLPRMLAAEAGETPND